MKYKLKNKIQTNNSKISLIYLINFDYLIFKIIVMSDFLTLNLFTRILCYGSHYLLYFS